MGSAPYDEWLREGKPRPDDAFQSMPLKMIMKAVPAQPFSGLLGDEGSHLARFFGAFPAVIRQEFAEIAEVQTVLRGRTVIEEGEEPRQFGYLLGGILGMMKVLPDGRTQIIGLLVPADMYGGLFIGAPSYRVEALTDSRVLCFDRARFELILLRNPEIERLILVNMLDELDAAREWILVLGGRRIIERVASFILILARRRMRGIAKGETVETQPIVVHVPLRRVDLAHYLGTRVETLSRAFHELQAREVLKINDAYHFEILDLGALVHIAGNDLVSGNGGAGG